MLSYTQLHSITLSYTHQVALSYAQLCSITLSYAQLHSVMLNYAQLRSPIYAQLRSVTLGYTELPYQVVVRAFLLGLPCSVEGPEGNFRFLMGLWTWPTGGRRTIISRNWVLKVVFFWAWKRWCTKAKWASTIAPQSFDW
jgi:hypothetical protein